MGSNHQTNEISKLTEELKTNKTQASNKYEQLLTGKLDIQENYIK